jgi:hypothetical protein
MDEDAAGDGAGGNTAGEEAPGGEVTVTRMQLREGGWIGYTDDAVFVDVDGETKIKVAHGNVTQVSLATLEWDMAVLSLLLVGVGTYVAATRNVLVGIAFGAVGCWSCYRTYTKRYELRIRVEGRHKPLSVHPVEPGACHERLADVTGLELH